MPTRRRWYDSLSAQVLHTANNYECRHSRLTGFWCEILAKEFSELLGSFHDFAGLCYVCDGASHHFHLHEALRWIQMYNLDVMSFLCLQ